MNRSAYFLAAVLLAGCGYIAPPLPPSLDLPARVTDLRVAEIGDQIVVGFTIPPLTTEGLPLKTVRSVELRVTAGGSQKQFEVTATGPGFLTKDIPATEWIGKDVTVEARATGPKGKVSAWSIPRTLPIQPPLARPTNLKAENRKEGVGLTWQGAGPHYRVFRADGEGKPAQVGESDKPEYVDTPIEYGTVYHYFVQAAAGELQQSDLSEVSSITPKDDFAPEVPAGLTAVPAGSAIELAWERNTESDFKGYNVYRAVEGGPFEKIASMIEAPTYSDRQVESGKKYRYAVSAVDQVGNESARSAVVEAAAQ